MRTAITIGIKKDGTAEIISHPKVSMHKQRADFRALTRGKNDKYVEVQYWPSKGRMLRRRFKKDEKGGVNYNAAHPVHSQQAAKKKGGQKLPDLTPAAGDTGGVNMAAALPIAQQGKAKKKKSARVRKPAAKKPAAASPPPKLTEAALSSKPAAPGDEGPTL